MTAPDLFDVPESLSPLRQFISDFEVRRAERFEADPEERWCAWFPASQPDPERQPDAYQCGFGATEEEAVEALAVRWGWLTARANDRRPVRVFVHDEGHGLKDRPGKLYLRYLNGQCYVLADGAVTAPGWVRAELVRLAPNCGHPADIPSQPELFKTS